MPVFGGGGAADDAADAAEKAAETQAEALEKGIKTQFRMFKIGRRDLAPYRKQGYAALNMLGQMYGLPPLTQRHITKKWKAWKRAGGEPGEKGGEGGGGEGAAQLSSSEQEDWLLDYIQHGHGRQNQRDIGAFGENIPEEVREVTERQLGRRAGGGGGEGPGDEPRKYKRKTMEEYGDPGEMIRQQPGYKFRYQEGLQAVDQSAAAGGRLYSGGQMRAVSRYGQEYASAEFDKVAGRLAQIAGLGGGASGQSANLAFQAGQGIAGSQAAIGTARASGYVGAANAQSQPGVLDWLGF